MHDSLLSVFLEVSLYQFMYVIYVILVLLVLLFTSILGFTIYKRKIEGNRKLWQQTIAPVISQAIFEDEEEAGEDLSYNLQTLLQNSKFRQYVINELVQVKKNLSGSSGLNLKKLYELLKLDKHSFEKLHNVKWHIKAKGIEELGIMEQTKYAREIFWITNNKNEQVRNAAQAALINFYGFSGLHFLNVTEYPVSQWQQIQLLNKLNDVKPDHFYDIKKWLQSPNESVKVFALKLAIFYNCQDVYKDVIDCLQSPDLQVKLNALKYLKKMPQEDTPDHIINNYAFENKAYKLTVIHALEDIGNEEQISFLLKKLHDKDDDIKAAAAKSLSSIHPLGTEFLQTHLFADEDPWKAIFLQITNERAA